MRLTTKGRFAVTAMLDLALQRTDQPVTLAMISQRQNISSSYLEQLFGKLRRRRLINSIRGPGGGYILARPARTVSVAEVVFAVDEQLDATLCAGKRDCHSDSEGKPAECMTHALWTALNNKMIEYLKSISLQDLVDEQHINQRQQKTLSKQLSVPLHLSIPLRVVSK